MEARELRIGNLVEYPNWSNNKDKCIFEIGSISKLNDEITVTKGLIKISSKNIYYFKPIPLTEEWLLKFGFDNTLAGIPSFHNGMFGLFWENCSLFLLTQGVCLEIPYIKSVHHLQNLYFALTGEELTIK